MTDQPEGADSESTPEPPEIMPSILPSPPKRRKNSILIGLGVAIAVICLCSVVLIIALVRGAYRVNVEKRPIEKVITAFMESMEQGDVQNAYTLFSPRARRQFLLADLESLSQGNNYVLFEGYDHLSIQNLSILNSNNSNSDLPQGKVADVTGAITYDGGYIGQFDAILEKVDGVWMIHRINVMAPPDKFSQ